MSAKPQRHAFSVQLEPDKSAQVRDEARRARRSLTQQMCFIVDEFFAARSEAARKSKAA